MSRSHAAPSRSSFVAAFLLAMLALVALARPVWAAPPVSVQVQQGAWRVEEAVGGEVAVTLTVVNQGPGAAENAVVVLGAQSEAQVRGSTPRLVAQEGRLVWPIGTLAAGDSAKLVLRVGASGEGEVLGRPVLRVVHGGQAIAVEGRRVVLYGPSLPIEYLGRTADADPTDPPIVHQAAVLGNDAGRIFRFVQRDVVLQPYAGSLQGARGALYGLGGNAIDRANLLVALLRASGVPAGYRFARLDEVELDRVVAGMFPPDAAQDHAGRPIDVLALRAEPESALNLVAPERRPELGDTRDQQLATLATMDEDGLRRLLLETGELEGPLREALRDHAWVEAWIDGRWQAMDPNLAGAEAGEVIGSAENATLAAAMPEERRHHVSLRMYDEEYQPVWGLGQLEVRAPVVTVLVGSGDLVGRTVVGHNTVHEETTGGMIFWVKQTRYQPSIEVHDLEQPTAIEVHAGAVYEEFASNFGGPLVQNTVTSVWMAAELLEPGQTEGQGEVLTKNVADRLPASARLGLPYDGANQDMSEIALDSSDVTTMLISASPLPARLLEMQQTLLRLNADEAGRIADDASQYNVDVVAPYTEIIEGHRSLQMAHTRMMASFYAAELANRERLMAQGLRQRPFSVKPRVMAAQSHFVTNGEDVVTRIGLDLMRETTETIGAPGQLVSDRRKLRMAHGMAATALEASVLDAMTEGEPASVNRIFAAANAANIPYRFLVGNYGIETLDRGVLTVSEEAQVRMRRALAAGKVLFTPTQSVVLDGQTVHGWYEFDTDGNTIGRMEDGSGGAALEYAWFIYKSACDLILECPDLDYSAQGLIKRLAKMQARMWAIILVSFEGAVACAFGAENICEKFRNGTYDNALQQAFDQVIGELGFELSWSFSTGNCHIQLPLISAIVESEFGCSWCGPATTVIEGICGVVEAFEETYELLYSALADPFVSPRPGGVIDGLPTDPARRSSFLRRGELTATLDTVDISGTAQAAHVRLTGGLSVAFGFAGPQVVPTRRLLAQNASLTGVAEGAVSAVDARWGGGDHLVALQRFGEGTLAGQGVLDFYGGALGGGLVSMGTFGDALSLGADGYTMTLAGQSPEAVLAMDAPGLPEPVVGLLVADGAPLAADTWAMSAASLQLGGAFAGPVGPSSVTATLSGGGLTLNGGAGQLDVGGSAVAVEGGRGFGGASGSVIVRRGVGALDEVEVDLTGAHQLQVQLDRQGAEATGPFVFAFEVATSLAGTYDLTAAGPDRWTVAMDGDTIRLSPPVGVVSGSYELTLTVQGPQGLSASARQSFELTVPAAPVAQLALVEDTRRSMDVGGVRYPAWLVELGHLGAEDGSYTLAATVEPPSMRVELAATEAMVRSGEVRRVGLVLLAAEEGAWPGAGEVVTVQVTATGSASASASVAWAFPGLSAVALRAAQTELIAAPGQTVQTQLFVRATGNQPALPRPTVSAASGVIADLGALEASLAPGQELALPLSLTVLPRAEAGLPVALPVTVELPLTPFEQERGLFPQKLTVNVIVAAPGTEGLVALYLQAAERRDPTLLTTVFDVLHNLVAARDACDAERVAALLDAVNRMASEFELRYNNAMLAAALRERATRLGLEGCDAVTDTDLPLFDEDELALGDFSLGPNLVGGFNLPDRVDNGEVLAVAGLVRNVGDTASGPTDAALTVLVNNAPVTIATLAVPALEPGAEAPFSVDWDTTTALGHLIVSLRVDPSEAVDEFQEDDNRTDAVIEIAPSDAAPADNHPPAFVNAPEETVIAGEDYAWTPEVTDPDGDPVFLLLVARPRGLRLEGSALIGRLQQPGEYEVVLAALDRYGATTTLPWTLRVLAPEDVNSPPDLTSRPLRRVVVGDTWTYAPTALDPEGSAVTWQLRQLPAGAVDTGSPEAPALSWTPDLAQVGRQWFDLIAEDEGGNRTRHTFTVEVLATRRGTDLVVAGIHLSGLQDDDATRTRSGEVVVSVANEGDTPAIPTRLVVYGERDFEEGLGAADVVHGERMTTVLQPGEVESWTIAVSGPVAFAGNLVHVMVDADDVEVEQREDNNVRTALDVDASEVRAMVGYRPVDASLTLLSAEAVAFAVVDPVTELTSDQGQLEPMVPWTANLTVNDGNGSFALDHFVVESDGPIQAYLSYEIFEPDFGGDMFHSARDGARVGRDFTVAPPTLTPNNRLVIVAVERALVELFDASGASVGSADLAVGQPWEPQVLSQGAAYRIVADGDVVVQSVSVTGFSVVPPANRLLATSGDVGQRFVFSTRSRGPSGGAVAVFAWDALDYTLTTADLQVLLSGHIEAGQYAFHAGIGEHRGLTVSTTGRSSVVAGDIARSGADRIGLMGEDITQMVGDRGIDLWVHSLLSDVGDSVVLAGPSGATVWIDDAPTTLGRYELLALPDDALYHLSASRPIAVQALGGADRYFDLGDALRVAPTAARLPRAVLSQPMFDTATCAAGVTATVRVGNGGLGAIPADAALELVQVDTDGEQVLAVSALGVDLGPGQWRDMTLSGAGSPTAQQRSWLLRLTRLGAGAGDVIASGAGGALTQAACGNLPPAFVSVPPASIATGARLAWRAQAVDPEGQTVTYALGAHPTGATLDAATGLLRWTAPGQPTTVGFTVIAADPAGAAALQRFELPVVAPTCADVDGDGFCPPYDCADADPAVGPGQLEIPGDGVDNDCNAATPDVIPPRGATLDLFASATLYGNTDDVTLQHVVTNLGQRLTLAGLRVDVEVLCNGEPAARWTADADVPTMAPGAAATVPLVWTLDGNLTGRCTAFARLTAGALLLDTASADFDVVAPLRGAIVATPSAAARGESVTLAWRVRNDAPVTVRADVQVTAVGLATPFVAEALTLVNEEVTRETVVPTADLLPGLYTARLVAGRTLLAQTVFEVTSEAAVLARWVPTGVDPVFVLNAATTDTSRIEARPLGPVLGGVPFGGVLRAGYNGDALTVVVDVRRPVPNDGDAVGLWISADGESLDVDAVWTRGQGLDVRVGDGLATPEERAVPNGTQLIFTVPTALVGPLEPGRTLRARIALRHGIAAPPGLVEDAWLWANAIGDDGQVDAYGTITLGDAPPVGDDAGADAGLDVAEEIGEDVAEDVADDVISDDSGGDAADPDAQPDADTPDSDGQADVTPDVPEPPDAAVDAAPDVTPGTGSGSGETPLHVEGSSFGGCGCATPSHSSPTWPALLALLGCVGAALLRRRRLGIKHARLLTILAIFIPLALLAGCDEDVTTGVGLVTDAGADADQDANGGRDVYEDDADVAAPDATEDAGRPDADVLPDAEPDIAIDADDTDLDADATPDTADADADDIDTPDTAPDAAPDTAPDAIEGSDVPPDFFGDATTTGGLLGELCTTDADCASGVCQHGVDFAVCTSACDAFDCPSGWTCERFPGGQRLCVATRICIDGDGDHYGLGRACEGYDCDDTRAEVYPGAAELCDGLDNDCDGAADEDLLNACGDCGPLPTEACNGVDDNCDGQVDEGLLNACGTCGAAPEEVCNNLDDDCDGEVDEGACTGCADGAERPCYPGAEATRGIGTCIDGLQTCTANQWGACTGYVLPSGEVCDALDNDCDGATDEGVLNRCGACGAEPLEVCDELDNDCDGFVDEAIETPCGGCQPCGQALLFPAEEGLGDPALAPAPDGGITIGGSVGTYETIWVPNSDENTFSRWNTRTGVEEGRYWVGTNPSRTAVDLNGDAWIGNRGDGTATHVYHNRTDCIDRNGDGVIQTSQDFNGDGRITGGEMMNSSDDPLADECVHCQVKLASTTELVRGIGVDANNYAWLGGWNTNRVYKVDPRTCEVLLEIDVQHAVYGVIITGDGKLFTSGFTSSCVAEIDTNTDQLVRRICDNGTTRYGIAVDGQGRIWYGNYGGGLLAFDPATSEWIGYGAPTNAIREATGVVADTEGNVYVAGYSSNTIGKYNINTGEWGIFNTSTGVPAGMTPCSNPRGVTIDSQNNLWAICRGNSVLLKFTPDFQVLGSYPIAGAYNPTIGTGPYSYSDNTGFQLFNYTAREGVWRNIFDAGQVVRFVRMTWSPYLPPNTSITVRVRNGNTEVELGQMAWSDWTDLTDIDLTTLTDGASQLLEMEFRLHTDDSQQRPVLRDLQVYFVTADCRQDGLGCPTGQLCDEVTGGCRVQPRQCADDGACGADGFCDAQGFCRGGCRIAPDSCGPGRVCDRDLRVCLDRRSDCALDNQCAAGSFCDGGFCTVGCRTRPDSCPPQAACDPTTHQCQPIPPECGDDAACALDHYCGPEGLCLSGCRVGTAECDTFAPTTNGFVTSWLTAGPVDAATLDLDRNYLITLGSEADFELRYGQLVSPFLPHVGLREGADYVNLSAHFAPLNANKAAYAMTWLEVAEDVDLELGVGADDIIRIWVGPETGAMTPVYEDRIADAASPDEERVPLHLTAGRHRVLVKTVQSTGGWGFYVRLWRDGQPWDGARQHVVARVCDTTTRACTLPAPDCDLALATAETCNFQDDDCNGAVDDATTDSGLTCVVGADIAGTTDCTRGRLMCRVTPSLDPDAPIVLGGTLTDAILPQGYYVANEFTFGGLMIVEPGASVRTIDTNPRWMWQATGAELDMDGAVFEGIWPRFDGNGIVRIANSNLLGIEGRDNTLRVYSASTVTLTTSTVTNMTLDTSANSNVVLEYARLDSSDHYGRWLATIRGRFTMRHSEAIGLNFVPRRQYGIGLYSSGPVLIEDSTLTALRVAALIENGTDVTLRNNAIEDPDYGVQIRYNANPLITHNTFYGTDLGLSTIGIYQDRVYAGAGGRLIDNVFTLERSDTAFWLDPDLFGEGTSATLTGTVLQGVAPTGQYRLSGDANAPVVNVGLIDLAEDYVLAQNVAAPNGTTLSFAPDLQLTNISPGWNIGLHAQGGGTINMPSPNIEDLTFFGDANSQVHLTGGHLRRLIDDDRYMVHTAGTVTIDGTLFESTVVNTGNNRQSRGVRVYGSGNGTINGATFRDLRYGAVAQDNSTFAITDSLFDGCQTAMYLSENTVADPVSGCTFIDDDPALLSVGIDLRFTNPGRAAIDAVQFDIGDEDWPISTEPDAYQAASPTTLTNLAFVDDRQGRGLGLRGESLNGDVQLTTPAGFDAITLRENTRFRQTSLVTVTPGTVIAGPSNTNTLFTLNDQARLTVAAGATFRDVQVQVGTGTTATFDTTTFTSTTGVDRTYVEVWGDVTLTDCVFDAINQVQQGVVTYNGATATLDGGVFDGLEYALHTYRGGAISATGALFQRNGRVAWITRLGDLTLTDCTVFDDLDDRQAVGVQFQEWVANAGPISLTATNTVFDLRADDIPFVLDANMLAPEHTLAISGSTFPTLPGRGYLLYGTVNTGTFTIAPLEPAQNHWFLNQTLRFQGDSHITLAAANRFRFDDVTVRVIEATGNATLDILAARFEDIAVSYIGTSTGTITGAAFLATRSNFSQLALRSPNPLVADGCTFGTQNAATGVNGIYVTGDPTYTPAIRNSAFSDLSSGVYIERGGAEPVLENNTFVNCGNTVYRRP